MSGYLDRLRAQSGIVVGSSVRPERRVDPAVRFQAHEIDEMRDAEPPAEPTTWPAAPVEHVPDATLAAPAPAASPASEQPAALEPRGGPDATDERERERAAVQPSAPAAPATDRRDVRDVEVEETAAFDTARAAVDGAIGEPPSVQVEERAETADDAVRPASAEPTRGDVSPVVREETPSEVSLRRLVEARRWVAATPAPGEAHLVADRDARVFEPVGEPVSAPVNAPRTHDGAEVVRERPSEPSEENVTVTIGTVVVTVEDAAAQASAPPAPPARDHMQPRSDAFRFDRLYLRR